MVLLMYSPTVYNQSCLWLSSLHSPSKSAINNASSSLLSSSSSSTVQQSHDWRLVLATGSSLSGYDLFRCAVILVVTCGLISGNLILALAVNCKYSAGILQFQVRLSSFPILTYYTYIYIAAPILFSVFLFFPSWRWRDWYYKDPSLHSLWRPFTVSYGADWIFPDAHTKSSGCSGVTIR